MISRYGKSNDIKGLTQVLTTSVPLALIWWAAVVGADASRWLTAGAMLFIILFTLRAFALMHECGHRSLFRSDWLNRPSGFLLGVVSGMPQFVWSQHHNYHHEYRHLFADVTRVKLSSFHRSLKCILWDAHGQKIISVAKYRRRLKDT